MKARSRAVVVAAVVGLALISAAPASAATPTEGLWYIDVFDVPEIHDAGTTGAGVTVAVIDSPLNLDVPTLQGADIETVESFCLDETGAPRASTSTDPVLAHHGTAVASLLVGTGEGYPGQTGVKGVAPGAHLLAYTIAVEDEGGCIHDDSDDPAPAMGASIADAVARGADIISVSVGVASVPEIDEAIASAIREGVIVVASLGNIAGADLDPATSNGVVSVNSVGPDGELMLDLGGDPNVSPLTDVVAPGVDILVQGDETGWESQQLARGTSFATPIVAGNLALAAQQWPAATGNQLIQSLIRNTGANEHELDRDDSYGYGVVVPKRLVAVDPTGYDDVNPLVVDELGVFPTLEQIYGDTASPSPDPSASPQPEDDGGWVMPLVIGGIVLLILVIAGIIVTAVVLGRRSGRETDRG